MNIDKDINILQNGITVSIVNYNTWSRTDECIDSILKNRPSCDFEILIHDNGESSSLVIQRANNIIVHKSPVNVGFGQGHNLNLENARYDTFIILNPDVTIFPETLDKLRKHITNGKFVAVSPILRFPNGAEQNSFRKFPSIRTEFARIFGLDREIDSPGSTLISIKANQGLLEVDQPAGAALALATKTMAKLKGFDAGFPMYFEDVDLCRRLKSIGKIVADTDCVVVHDGEGTAKEYREATTFWIEYSRRLYHKKHSKGVIRQLLLIFCSISCLTHYLAAILTSYSESHKIKSESRAKATGYLMSIVSSITGSDQYWRERFLKL